MESLYFPFEVKAAAESGRFSGYASTFGNVDRQEDIVMPGAFTKTLERTGGRVPILFGHDSRRPIGFGLSASEDSQGLKVEGEFTLGSDEGRNAFEVVKHAAKLNQKLGLSIGYEVPSGGFAMDGDIRRLKEVELWEYSLALFPANPQARISAVKSDEESARRYLRGQSPEEIGVLLKTLGFTRKQRAGILAGIEPEEPEPTEEKIAAAFREEKAALSVRVSLLRKWESVPEFRRFNVGASFEGAYRQVQTRFSEPNCRGGYVFTERSEAKYAAYRDRLLSASWLSLSTEEAEDRAVIEEMDGRKQAERSALLGVETKNLR